MKMRTLTFVVLFFFALTQLTACGGQNQPKTDSSAKTDMDYILDPVVKDLINRNLPENIAIYRGVIRAVDYQYARGDLLSSPEQIIIVSFLSGKKPSFRLVGSDIKPYPFVIGKENIVVYNQKYSKMLYVRAIE